MTGMLRTVTVIPVQRVDSQYRLAGHTHAGKNNYTVTMGSAGDHENVRENARSNRRLQELTREREI